MIEERGHVQTITAGEPPVSLKTWIAVGGAMIGAFMAVLNIQITNASLRDIEGGIGTGGINGAWITTAYLIGEIIVIPLSDYLSRVFSLRRYLIANTALFLLFSALCGQAHSLPEMIVLRALQGFAGGVLIPLAFTIVVRHAAAVASAPIGLAGVRVDRDLRAGDRPDDRRLSHRHLRLADDLLHQPGARRGDAGDAGLRAAALADAARPAAPRRLAGHRADGGRPGRAADRARRGQRLRLVRLALHRAS